MYAIDIFQRNPRPARNNADMSYAVSLTFSLRNASITKMWELWPGFVGSDFEGEIWLKRWVYLG